MNFKTQNELSTDVVKTVVSCKLEWPEILLIAGTGLCVAGGSAKLIKQKKEGTFSTDKLQKNLNLVCIALDHLTNLLNDIKKCNPADESKLR